MHEGWIEHKSDDEIAEIEGWLGTIEGGQVTTSDEDGMERMGVEPSDSDQGEVGEQQQKPDDVDEGDDEDEEPSDSPTYTVPRRPVTPRPKRNLRKLPILLTRQRARC